MRAEQDASERRLKGAFQLFKEAFRIYCGRLRTSFVVLSLPICFSILSLDLLYLLRHTPFYYSFAFSVLEFLLYLTITFLFLRAFIALVLGIGEEEGKEARKSILPFAGLILLYLMFILGTFALGMLISSFTLLIPYISDNRVVWWIICFFLAGIPTIYLKVRFSLFPFPFFFENARGFKALHKSEQLTKGRFWRTFLALILIFLIWAISSFGFSLIITWKIDYIPLSDLLFLIIFLFFQLLLVPLVFNYLFLIYREYSEAGIIKEEKPALKDKISLALPGLIGAFCLIFLISFGIFRILGARDEPPPKDMDLRLSKVETPPEKNAYYALLEAFNKRFPQGFSLGFDKWSKAYLDMDRHRNFGSEEVKEWMKRNEGMFNSLQHALELPYLQIPWLQDPNNISIFQETLHMDFHIIRGELGVNCIRRAHYLLHLGDDKSAFDWALRAVKLGWMLEESPRASLIAYLGGYAIEQMGFGFVQENVGKATLQPAMLRQYARGLFQKRDKTEALKRIAKMEYILISNSLRDTQEAPRIWKSFRKKMMGKYFFSSGEGIITSLYLRFATSKPNSLRQVNTRIVRIFLSDVGRFYKDMKLPKMVSSSQSKSSAGEFCTFYKEEGLSSQLKDFLKTIFQGELAAAGLDEKFLQEGLARILETKCFEEFQFEATAVLFALKAYQMEKGNLPDSLNELVPQYLPQLPIDPYDGKPLRYSKEKKIIYTVGKGLQDVGGSLGEKGHWRTWRNPTIVIDF